VLAADVFVNVNELSPILTNMARALTPAGIVAFTVETHADDGVELFRHFVSPMASLICAM